MTKPDADHDLLLQVHERLIALTEKVEREFAARDRALELQAKEVERRLEGLNHEAARINAAAAKSVSAEVYEADKKATALALTTAEKQSNAAFSLINTALSEHRGQRIGTGTILGGVVIIVTIVISLATVILLVTR